MIRETWGLPEKVEEAVLEGILMTTRCGCPCHGEAVKLCMSCVRSKCDAMRRYARAGY